MATTPSGLPFFFRYSQDFIGLPPIYKWEFTRRHPYYVRYWRMANECRRLQADPQKWNKLKFIERRRLGDACLVLTSIGAIASEYPDPAIDGRVEKNWTPPFDPRLVRAMSMREHLHLLLYFLPQEVQKAVARVYLREIAHDVASDDGKTMLTAVAKSLSQSPPPELEAELIRLKGDAPLHERLNRCLCSLSDPELDMQVPGIVYVNYQMPFKDIDEELRTPVSGWKREFGISETRRRPDQWDAYLDVWDRREGWRDGGYDGKRELRLRDIARQLGVPRSTAQAQYGAAYKLIVGRDYDPTDWLALFSPVKLDSPKWASWRRAKGLQPTDALGNAITGTPTTHSTQVEGRADAINQVAGAGDSAAYDQLVADLKTMFANGRSYEDVTAELDLEISPEEFAVLQARFEDGLF